MTLTEMYEKYWHDDSLSDSELETLWCEIDERAEAEAFTVRDPHTDHSLKVMQVSYDQWRFTVTEKSGRAWSRCIDTQTMECLIQWYRDAAGIPYWLEG